MAAPITDDQINWTML